MDNFITARFWDKVDKFGPIHPALKTRCWLWMACKDKDGYGFFKFEGKQHKAHRVAFKLHYGKWPIPNAMHKCDVPGCVRWSHLQEGTTLENNVDRDTKGRGAVGSKNGGGAKLTDAKVREIRRLHADEGWSYRLLAARFKVHKSRIARVMTGKNWKHVT
jgi:hypothetical protein